MKKNILKMTTLFNKHIFRIVLAVMVSAGCWCDAMAEAYSVDRIENVHVKDRTRYVSNQDGILSAETVSRLDTMLGQVWQQTSAEPVVVAVNDIDTDPDEFATELMESWGIGKKDKDNGVLLLIVKDQRKAVIRTGDGAEGVLPDIVCGRILREDMFPRFKEGDFDGGTLAAVERMSRVIADPSYADELKSSIANDSRRGHASGEEEDFWPWVVRLSVVGGCFSLVIVMIIFFTSRKESEPARYATLDTTRNVMLFLSFLFLGCALPAYLLTVWKMKRIRNHKRKCPNCGTWMKKLDEETDNRYLTPAEDAEERLNSIDYDVWLCPDCGETDIIPYINKRANYKRCQRCGARTAQLTATRTLVKPTTRSAGRGVKIYTCRNCGNRQEEPYEIPKLADAAPVVIIPGAMGGSGIGGGGFSGGSFGGGGTAGGGASGGW